MTLVLSRAVKKKSFTIAKECTFKVCVLVIAAKTTVTPEQRSQGDPKASKKNVERRGVHRCAQYDRKHLPSSAVASPVDAVRSHRTQKDDTHFEHAQNKVLKEHSWVAVWSP